MLNQLWFVLMIQLQLWCVFYQLLPLLQLFEPLLELEIVLLSALFVHLVPVVADRSVAELLPLVVPLAPRQLVLQPIVLGKPPGVQLLHKQLVVTLGLEPPIVLDRQLLGLLVQRLAVQQLAPRLLVLAVQQLGPLLELLVVPAVVPAVVVVLDTEHRPVVVVFAAVELDMLDMPVVEQAVVGTDSRPAVVLDIDNIVVVQYKLSNRNPWWLLFTIFTKFWLTNVAFMLQ